MVIISNCIDESILTDLPDEKPRITGIKEKYQIGETMEALCTSWQSHPPANLTWFINEEKVMKKLLHELDEMSKILHSGSRRVPAPSEGSGRV